MNLKDEIMAAISQHGFEDLKRVIVPNFLKMVGGTKVKKQLGVSLIATGYSHFTREGLNVAIECLLEVMPPEEEETVRLREAYKYFKENEEEILADHNVTH